MASIASSASINNSVHLGNVAPPEEIHDCKKALRLDGRLLIQFRDGSHDAYDLSTLRNLGFFKTMEHAGFQETFASEAELIHIDREAFRLVCLYVAEKKPLHQLITAEMLQNNVHLFDSFVAALNFLHPIEGVEAQCGRDKTEERYDTLCWQIASLIDFETAKTISTAHAGEKSEVPTGLEKDAGVKAEKEAPKAGILPFAVERAHEILLQAAFFATEKEASEHFEMVCSARIQKELAEDNIARMEVILSRHNSAAQQALAKAVIQQQKTLIHACDGLLKKAQKRVDINYLTVSEHAVLAAKVNDPCPRVQLLAQQSAKFVQEYAKDVLEAFRTSKADLSRTDLLEYFIGPKGFLLEHYGLFPDPTHKNPAFPFVRKLLAEGNSFEYSLKHNSIYDVENEMRDDLTRLHLSLPERLIKERVRTKAQTEETCRIRKVILPVLRDWTHQTDAAKREVAEQLLHHLKWEKISPDDIELGDQCPLVMSRNLEREELTLTFKKPRRVSFNLNFWDLKTCYDQFQVIRELPSYEVLREANFVAPVSQ